MGAKVVISTCRVFSIATDLSDPLTRFEAQLIRSCPKRVINLQLTILEHQADFKKTIAYSSCWGYFQVMHEGDFEIFEKTLVGHTRLEN